LHPPAAYPQGAHAIGNQTSEKTKVLIDVGDDNVASITVKPSNCSLHDCTAQSVSVKGDDDPTLVRWIEPKS
jgi:hypothetical protein